jgi:small-conductance mechanosensitive channel
METLIKILPSAATGAALVLVLVVVHRLLERGKIAGHQFRNQVVMLALTAAGLLVLALVIPISDTMRGQVLSFLGILLSAAIALSATTILGNAMAGVMLRPVKNFRTGDFIRSGEHFGRVSERGLFHTEIQTEARELTTLPNLYLVTHPVTTIRSSGTIVSTSVSLGYDVPRDRIEDALLAAAAKVGLDEPFVHVLDLGDFAVTYRVPGLLREVKQLISSRSRLLACVMDRLHEAGIEIVSPNFMNTRAIKESQVFVPRQAPREEGRAIEAGAEAIAFDKAEEAETLESLRLTFAKMTEEIEAAERALKQTTEGPEREQAERGVDRLRERRERLKVLIAGREAEAAETE